MTKELSNVQSVSEVKFPPSHLNDYTKDMQALETALQAFQGATDPSQRAMFAAQVQELINTVNSDYNTLLTDGNGNDAAFADKASVRAVFNDSYGILNTPVEGTEGGETLTDAAGKGSADDMETALGLLVNGSGGFQFTQLLTLIQKATPNQ